MRSNYDFCFLDLGRKKERAPPFDLGLILLLTFHASLTTSCDPIKSVPQDIGFYDKGSYPQSNARQDGLVKNP